jgi:elongator complex protein 3
MRIMREIPKEKMVQTQDKLIRLDIRKDIEENFKKQGIKVNEIRMREIGFNRNNKKAMKEGQELKLKKVEYVASGGKEYFLEVVNENDILYGLLRLRILPNEKDTAMVRELHVYGKAKEIGAVGELSQHTGLGKQLMAEAEKISKENNCNKIKVISGVGVREYYKKLGYELDKDKIYMEKELID